MFRRLIELVFGIDSSGVKPGLDKVKSDVNKFRADTVKGLKGAFAPLARIGTLVGAGAALGAIGTKVLNFAQQVRDGAKEIGISAEELQKFIGVAARYNIQTDEAIDLLKELSQRAGEAREGEGELNEALQRYDVSLRHSNGSLKTNQDLLRDLADLMKNARDEQERLFIADQAFGSSGGGIARFLSEGSEALDMMMEKAAEAGGVLQNDLIERLADSKAEWAEFANFALIQTGRVIGGINDIIRALRGLGLNDAQQQLFESRAQAEAEADEKFGHDVAANRRGRGRNPRRQFIEARTEELEQEKAAAKGLQNLEDQKAREAQIRESAAIKAREQIAKTAAKEDAARKKREAEEKRLADQLASFEKKLADAKESRMLAALDTEGKIKALVEKRAILEAKAGRDTKPGLEAAIELENVLAQLAQLREKADDERTANEIGETNFAVSSLARIGGGGNIGPGGKAADRLLTENQKQTRVLEEIKAGIDSIEFEQNSQLLMK